MRERLRRGTIACGTLAVLSASGWAVTAAGAQTTPATPPSTPPEIMQDAPQAPAPAPSAPSDAAPKGEAQPPAAAPPQDGAPRAQGAPQPGTGAQPHTEVQVPALPVPPVEGGKASQESATAAPPPPLVGPHGGPASVADLAGRLLDSVVNVSTSQGDRHAGAGHPAARGAGGLAAPGLSSTTS